MDFGSIGTAVEWYISVLLFFQAATRCDSMTLTPGQWLGLPAVTAVTLYRHEDPALVGAILLHLLLMSHPHKQSAPNSPIFSCIDLWESFCFCVVFLSVFLDCLFFFFYPPLPLSRWQQVWHRASRWRSCEHCLSGSPYSALVTMGLWRRSNTRPFWYESPHFTKTSIAFVISWW